MSPTVYIHPRRQRRPSPVDEGSARARAERPAPGTGSYAAADTAKRFGVECDWKRLVSDPVYNTQMGGTSPSFVREPEGNGVAERFIRTLKENLLWVRTFDTIEELRAALVEFARHYNETWLVARHGYRTPAQVRADQCRLDQVLRLLKRTPSPLRDPWRARSRRWSARASR